MKKRLFKLDLKEFSTISKSANEEIKTEYLAPGQNSNFNKSQENLDAFNFLELIKVWPEIVGEKIAEHTVPLKNTYQTLVVLSDHSAFSSALSYMEMDLKRKILNKFPRLASSVKQLKFVVDSNYFKAQKNLQENTVTKKNKFTPPHPYSPEYKKLKAEAESLFSDIEDAEMKQKLISLYYQVKSN